MYCDVKVVDGDGVCEGEITWYRWNRISCQDEKCVVTDLEPGFALLQSFSCSSTASNFKGQDGTIDIVVRSIDQHGFDAENGKASDDAVAENRLNALLHTWDVFFGHRTTFDFTGKNKKKKKKKKKKKEKKKEKKKKKKKNNNNNKQQKKKQKRMEKKKKVRSSGVACSGEKGIWKR